MRGLGLAALGLLAGCAQAPEDVAPAYVSSVPYEAWSCGQLAQERLILRVAVAESFSRQTKARAGDTMGVLLLGLPTASMSGEDEANSLAQLKGHQRAIDDVSAHKACTISAPRAPS